MRRAHAAVAVAIRKGRLTKQPCAVCGSLNAHAHHEDYSKPLDVMWLCPAHHNARHRALGWGVHEREKSGNVGRTINLPPELWERLEQFRVEEHLSSVAEAMRVILWRELANRPAPAPKPKRKGP